MCRAKSHCSGGRRCDEGRTYIRSARRRNARALNSVGYINLASEMVEVDPRKGSFLVDFTEEIEDLSENEFRNLTDDEKSSIVSGELTENFPESLFSDYEEGSAHLLEALQLAQLRDDLSEVTNDEMVSLKRNPDDNRARLASIKRRLKILEMRESMGSLIDDAKYMSDEELSAVCKRLKTSGALIAAEGSYQSGIYVDEEREKMSEAIAHDKKLREDHKSLLNSRKMSLLLELRDAIDEGEFDGEKFNTKKMSDEEILSTVEEKYPNHRISTMKASLDKRIASLEEEIKKNKAINEKSSEKLNGACMSVIKSSKPFGMRQSKQLEHSVYSDASGVKKVESAIEEFPQKWWDRANYTNLHIKDLDVRSHYVAEGRKTYSIPGVYKVDHDDSLRRFREGKLGQKPSDQNIVDVENGLVYAPFKPRTMTHNICVNTIKLKNKEAKVESYTDKDIWVKVPAKVETYFGDEKKKQKMLSSGWVEGPKITKDGKEGVYLYRINDPKKIKDKGKKSFIVVPHGKDERETQRVTAHEMAHLFEYEIDSINKIERAFYRERTQGESIKSYALGEFVREDNFVDNYMGKDYTLNKKGKQTKSLGYAFEILSTGTESLKGEFGGLLGLSPDYRKADHDMRNFILGVYSNL